MKANQVLRNLEWILKEMDGLAPSRGRGRIVRKCGRPAVRTEKVWEELGIFDWWDDGLTKSQLREMERFLKRAIKLGYTGLVRFVLGAKGCSHGMWAYKIETSSEWSQESECLFHSFRNGDNYYSVKLKEGWLLNAAGTPAELNLKQLKSVL